MPQEPTRYHLQLLPVNHLLGKLFKYLTRCGRGADTPPVCELVDHCITWLREDWFFASGRVPKHQPKVPVDI